MLKQQTFGGVKKVEQTRQTFKNRAWPLSEMRPVLRPEAGDRGQSRSVSGGLRRLRVENEKIQGYKPRNKGVEPCEEGLNIQYAASVTMN